MKKPLKLHQLEAKSFVTGSGIKGGQDVITTHPISDSPAFCPSGGPEICTSRPETCWGQCVH